MSSGTINIQKLFDKINNNLERNSISDTLVEIAVSFGVAKEEVERKIKNLICHFSRQIKKNLKITARYSEKVSGTISKSVFEI